MSSWIAKHKRIIRAPLPERLQRKELREEEVAQDIQIPNDRLNWNPSVKRYLSGGKLGDFIYQLYVIYYNYKYYGKKGILYIGNVGDNFRFGLEKTYNDTRDLILSQEYIEDYQIYTNQKYDLNLSNWRALIRDTNEKNWYEIYLQAFDVPWGNTKWITIDTDSYVEDSILLNHSTMRFNQHINYKKLIDEIKQNHTLFFICFDMFEYEQFQLKYNVSMPVIVCKSINEMYQKINRCKLFIGNLSAPLAFSLSLHKQSIGILPTDPMHHFTDVKLNSNLDTMPFYKLIRNEHDVDTLLYSLQLTNEIVYDIIEQVVEEVEPVVEEVEPVVEEVEQVVEEVEQVEQEVEQVEQEVEPVVEEVEQVEQEEEPVEQEVEEVEQEVEPVVEEVELPKKNEDT